MTRAKIIGTGSAVPDRVLTNHDLEQMVETSDDWITVRTGIKERRVAAEGEFTSTFATRAAQRALEMAGVDPADLDLIICGTVTPDFPFPSTACIVQNNLGATRAAAFDISAACSGFLYGLSIADKFIKTGSCHPRPRHRGGGPFPYRGLDRPEYLLPLRRWRRRCRAGR